MAKEFFEHRHRTSGTIRPLVSPFRQFALPFQEYLA